MKRILQMLGDNLFLLALLIILLIVVALDNANAQELPDSNVAATPDGYAYCQDWAKTKGHLETTGNVVISGDAMTNNDWTVPHDTITITFGDEPALVFNQYTSSNQSALMDWIATVLHYETETAVPAFAGRNADGQVWIVSVMDTTGNPDVLRCIAQPLDSLN